MKSEHYDLIVIGAGSAARDGANKAAKEHGAKVALIERERWGGSCPNVACTPTKAYLVAADLAHDINTLANKLGIEVGPATTNLAKVRARKETLKKPQAKWVEDLEAAGFDTYAGTASFVEPQTVRVGDAALTADKILIATGSRTAVPPVEGIDEIDWLDHITALDLEELPETLLIVGAGAVGLEFGQAFARFGSQVTLVDALDQIAPQSDHHAAMELREALEDEGIQIILGSFVQKVTDRDGRHIATIVPREGGMAKEVEFDRLLLASGRRRRELQARDRGRRADAHERPGDLGRGRRQRAGPVHARRAVPGANRGRRHVPPGRRPGSRLHGAAGGDLHRPRARQRRADGNGGRGAGLRVRDRRPPAEVRPQGVVHRREARALQDRLRPPQSKGTRAARRLSRRQRHRPGTLYRAAARRHRRRARERAPRVPDLRRGREGSGRAGARDRAGIVPIDFTNLLIVAAAAFA